MADELLRKKLAELINVAKEHGHTSEQVRKFVLDNLGLDEFMELAAVILLLVKDESGAVF